MVFGTREKCCPCWDWCLDRLSFKNASIVPTKVYVVEPVITAQLIPISCQDGFVSRQDDIAEALTSVIASGEAGT